VGSYSNGRHNPHLGILLERQAVDFWRLHWRSHRYRATNTVLNLAAELILRFSATDAIEGHLQGLTAGVLELLHSTQVIARQRGLWRNHYWRMQLRAGAA